MRRVTYFAVFEPSDTGYSIYFPDLPGCISCGDNIEHATKMAKEALGLHYWGMEKDGDEIPKPTKPPFEDMESVDFVVPVEIFPDIVKDAIENRAVKKTLTIPHWLNAEAEAANVNFSQLLQNALKEYLNVSA
ncbi:MAG: type II toxin-antitoxin system HicB family antitoxin [Clostridiales bacterium]|jgi:predicted RNase H-like HicB family nuclease|nr:type II toxin-antitoxin system HicB family antitoxin [Clostridiales bacterium]